MIADHDHAGLGKTGFELTRGGEAVQAAHLEIHQHPIGMFRRVAVLHLAAIRALGHHARRQEFADRLPESGVIIDDEILRRRALDFRFADHVDNLRSRDLLWE